MWLYNVTRAVIATAGYKVVVPEDIRHTNEELFEQAYKVQLGDQEIYCAKLHLALPRGLPDTKIIFSYRDVRDAALSYMRFMRCDFSTMLATAIGMMQVTDFYHTNHSHGVLRLRYEKMTTNSVKAIRAISSFLECPIPENAIRSIAEQFSRDKVAKFIEGLSQLPVDAHGRISEESGASQYATIPNVDGSFRAIDRNTLFQTGHITSKHEGEWRQALNEDQRKALMDHTAAWLTKYGYKL
jgi:hypothetical protein